MELVINERFFIVIPSSSFVLLYSHTNYKFRLSPKISSWVELVLIAYIFIFNAYKQIWSRKASDYAVVLQTAGPGIDSRWYIHLPCVCSVSSLVNSWSIFSSLLWVLSLEKISLYFRDKSKLWRWIVLSSIDRAWGRTHAIILGPCFSGDALFRVKSYHNVLWDLVSQVA